MLIPLTEYAKKHERAVATVRQKVLRGGFKTAQKIGRDWMIEDDEPYMDERRNDMEKDRSYLFGELFAVLEDAETDALGDDSVRILSLKSRYTRHPRTTFGIIERDIMPDIRTRMAPEQLYNVKDRIAEILSEMDTEKDFTDDELGPMYLIGYYKNSKIRGRA